MSRSKILAPLITWWFWHKSFCNQKLFLSISEEWHVSIKPTEKILFVNSYLSLRLIEDMILPFSNNCDRKLIPLLEDFGKCITVPSILMYLLNHINWDNIWEEVSGDPHFCSCLLQEGARKNVWLLQNTLEIAIGQGNCSINHKELTGHLQNNIRWYGHKVLSIKAYA